MDFVHNPYRCGPLRVGRYMMRQHVIYRLGMLNAKINYYMQLLCIIIITWLLNYHDLISGAS